MNRSDYLENLHVRDFIDWATPLVTGEWGLTQSWSSSRPAPVDFSCKSLYEAYEKYEWGGLDFNDTVRHLNRLGVELRNTTSRGIPGDQDKERFLVAAKEVVHWGGIHRLKRSLDDSLDDLDTRALQQFKANARLLDPESADTDSISRVTLMGSGYSKIYACILDDFPMYDSRVACALTSLVWLFCREKALDEAPAQLKLGVPPFRTQERNPYQFPKIYAGTPHGRRKHAESNLKAAWLLGELSGRGQFADLPPKRRVMALQSALFMIGYKPLIPKSIQKA